MKIIAKVKLNCNPETKQVLLETILEYNLARNFISDWMWSNQEFNKYTTHNAIYHTIRHETRLGAQATVRAIADVADAYKSQFEQKKKRKHKIPYTKVVFKSYRGITYDARNLSWQITQQQVSVWTVGGRYKIPFSTNQYNLQLLSQQDGQTDLLYKNGSFYLNTICTMTTPPENYFDDVIGVDMGVINIVATSDGDIVNSTHIERKRLQHHTRRVTLAKVGTRSAKRRLQKLSGKQARFQKDLNHKIAKWLVLLAKDTNRAIALENLEGIRDGVTVRREQRAKHHNWSFHQLRRFIEYKSKIYGVRVFIVDPRNTSRTCPACGYIDKANRKTQSEFLCLDCGYTAHVDVVGAINIKNKGSFNLPMVAV